MAHVIIEHIYQPSDLAHSPLRWTDNTNFLIEFNYADFTSNYDPKVFYINTPPELERELRAIPLNLLSSPFKTFAEYAKLLKTFLRSRHLLVKPLPGFGLYVYADRTEDFSQEALAYDQGYVYRVTSPTHVTFTDSENHTGSLWVPKCSKEYFSRITEDTLASIKTSFDLDSNDEIYTDFPEYDTDHDYINPLPKNLRLYYATYDN
jgi:hypothetical protein